jgi:hypothetical protein
LIANDVNQEVEMLEEIKQKLEEEIGRLMHELTVQLPIAIRKAVELGDLSDPCL